MLNRTIGVRTCVGPTAAPLIWLGGNRYSRWLRALTGLSPFRADAERQGKQARVDLLSIGVMTAPAEVAERLQLPEGAEVVERVNHYFTDDEPVQIGVTFVPARPAPSLRRTPGLVAAASMNASPSSATTSRVREEITARMPRPDEVATLAIPAGVPVIELLHTGIDQHGQPSAVTRFVMRADRSAPTTG